MDDDHIAYLAELVELGDFCRRHVHAAVAAIVDIDAAAEGSAPGRVVEGHGVAHEGDPVGDGRLVVGLAVVVFVKTDEGLVPGLVGVDKVDA